MAHSIVTIEPATIAHAESIAANARAADVQEFLAMSGDSPIEVLQRALQRDHQAVCGLVDGVPVTMWGCASGAIAGGVGLPWMVGSKHLDRHALYFLYHCRDHVATMRDRFGFLCNWVDARNVRAVQWLRWLGFTLETPQPAGIAGLPFHKFWMNGAQDV